MIADALSFVRISVAQCESEHAKHRQASSQKDQCVSFARFAATSVNRQVQETGAAEIVNAKVYGSKLALTDEKTASRASLSLEDRMQTYSKPQSELQLNRADWVSDQRCSDSSFDCVSTEAWQTWREAWEELPDECKQIYHDLAISGEHLCRSRSALALQDVGTSVDQPAIANVRQETPFRQVDNQHGEAIRLNC